MKNILVIRYTAIGDVALTVPVIESLAESHPQYNIIVLTQPQFAPLFEFMPGNVTFMGMKHKEYNGFGGARRLYKKITSKYKIDAVVDLHGKLRTLLLDLMFKLHFVKVSVVRKERRKRNQLIRLHNKKLEQLRPITELYVRTFNRLGIDFDIHFKSIYPEIKGNMKEIDQIVGEKNGKWIGVAPFASSEGKVLTASTTEKVIAGLSQRGYRIFIFAFGEKELAVARPWAEKYTGAELVTKELGGLKGELNLISHLDMLIGMDSSNMHLASCVGTPVVSVWGATHPYTGFLGYKQSINNAVQVDLPCRPCTIKGNRKCRYGDYRCMANISAEDILNKIK